MARVFFVVLFAIASLQAHAIEWSSKVHRNLQIETAAGSSADILVFLGPKASLEKAETIIDRGQRLQFVYRQLTYHAEKSQAALIQFLQKKGLTYQSFYINNSLLVENATPDLIQELAQFPEVALISLNLKVRLKLPPPTTVAVSFNRPKEDDVEDNLKQIHADKVWNELGVRGEGIVVAGGDSGFKFDHPALSHQYRGYGIKKDQHKYNWHDAIHHSASVGDGSSCPPNRPAPCDDMGHGTHTMGIMLGYDSAGATNHIGVAPKAKWVGCRNMNGGVGKPSTYLECFQYFLAPYPEGGNPAKDGKPQFAPHVINNSWGCPLDEGCTGREFIQAIDNVQAAGILVVVSAGNDGPGCQTVAEAPATQSAKVLAVGSYNAYEGDASYFSSRGPSSLDGSLAPNISAPGDAIRSSVPSGGMGDDGLYDVMSGTSMAGPHVAGAVALLWSAHPALIGNIPATRAILEKTAQPKTSDQDCGSFSGRKVPNAVFGYGVVDAYAAIKSVH